MYSVIIYSLVHLVTVHAFITGLQPHVDTLPQNCCNSHSRVLEPHHQWHWRWVQLPARGKKTFGLKFQSSAIIRKSSLDVRHWTHNLHSRYKPIRLTASIKVIRMQMQVIKPDTLLTPSVTFVMKICSFSKHKLTALIWTAVWVNNTTSEMQVNNQVSRHRLSCSLSSRGGAAFMMAHFHSSHFSGVQSVQTDQVCLTDRNGDKTQMVTWWCDFGGVLTLLFLHSSLCISIFLYDSIIT